VSGELGHAIGPRLEGLAGHGDHGDEPGRQRAQPDGSTATAGFWSACDWLPCRDGKARPVEPGSFPLAHGIPARVVRLRAYGNSIVPQVAAEFIGAYLDVRGVA
jgi:DNA (cytosine-5)-methyltransferase 1